MRKKEIEIECRYKSKVMRCSRYGNGDRIHVILNCELGSQWQLMEDVKGMWYTE